jgi:hypothetical protein
MSKFSELDIDRQNQAAENGPRHIEAHLCFEDRMTGECYIAPFMLTQHGGAFRYPFGFQETPYGTPLSDSFPAGAARELLEAAIASALNRPASVDVDFDE